MAAAVRAVKFIDKLGFLFEPKRYKIAYGGRGGGKSIAFARALIIQAAQRPMRILCCREIQKSIADSVHTTLSDEIAALGLGSRYDVKETRILGGNGSEFIFAGLRHNVSNIKSIPGIDVAWVEEAHSVSKASLDVLIPTVRKDNSEIWLSFNPDEETDPAYVLATNPPDDATVVKIGWEDNPWFPEVLRKEKDYLYRVDTEAAEHVWGGSTRKNSVAQVLRGRYRIESFAPQPGWSGPYYGADWGFATDPTALVRLWVSGRTLYVEHEAYGIGIEIDNTPALFEKVPESQKHIIRADSARPETISYMKQHGYPLIVAAEKGPGSVEDGTEHLRSYEAIVIHPRCTHFAEEAKLWSYKTDRLTGDVLPVLVDKHNHCMDSARYALEPIIRARSWGIEGVKIDVDDGHQASHWSSLDYVSPSPWTT